MEHQDPAKIEGNAKTVLSPLYERSRELVKRIQDVETHEGAKAASVAVSTAAIVSGSAAEQTLYQVTLPHSSFQIGNLLQAVVPFIYLNSTVADATLIVRAYYGGSLFVALPSITPVHNAIGRAGKITLELRALGLTTKQEALGNLRLGPLLGNSGVDSFSIDAAGTLSTIDSELDQLFKITVQHGTSDPNISLTGKSLRILGPFRP